MGDTMEKRKTVKVRKPRSCSDCGSPTELRNVEQEYEREGIRVRIDGIPAMVCSQCGSVSFAAGIPDQIITAANAMFEIAREQHRGVLTAKASL